jgi:excisionase family DNA binding protein
MEGLNAIEQLTQVFAKSVQTLARAETEQEQQILTLAEVAVLLRVPENTVRLEAEAGRLVGRNLGGEWRFVRSAIVDWLQTPRKSSLLSTASATTPESDEEYQSFMASIRAFRDEINRTTKSGKYAEE